jgi:hypothetical protein
VVQISRIARCYARLIIAQREIVEGFFCSERRISEYFVYSRALRLAALGYHCDSACAWEEASCSAVLHTIGSLVSVLHPCPHRFKALMCNADIKTIALHEAGHLLMLWLLDRYAIGCIITEEDGLTKALDDNPGEKKTPHQRILYAMSGMVLAGDFDLLSGLRQNAAEPDHFDKYSDSHYIVEALPHIGGDPKVVLSLCQDIILRLGSRFRSKGVLSIDVAYFVSVYE